jgi:hypothetical protein
MTHRPIGIGSSVLVSVGAASTSQPFLVYSNSLRVVSTSNAFVKIDSEPVASRSDYYLPANTPATLAVTPASQRVTGIVTGATTVIDFPSGTGSPFNVGDYVSLSVESQSYYNFTHKQIISIDNSSGNNGYYSRRITVDNNSSGILTALSENTSAELRKSMKVGSFGNSAGVLYYQQVQITGEA